MNNLQPIPPENIVIEQYEEAPEEVLRKLENLIPHTLKEQS